jgi:hypothetical protein
MIIDIKVTEETIPARLPKGKYVGEWVGYLITLLVDGRSFRLHTTRGVQGVIPCSVEVMENGEIDVNPLNITLHNQ